MKRISTVTIKFCHMASFDYPVHTGIKRDEDIP